MSLACMELQLEQWSHNKGKNSECGSPLSCCQQLLHVQMLDQNGGAVLPNPFCCQ